MVFEKLPNSIKKIVSVANESSTKTKFTTLGSKFPRKKFGKTELMKNSLSLSFQLNKLSKQS